MKSFGLWYQLSQKEQKQEKAFQPQFSLHVNFWSLEDIKIKENGKEGGKDNIKTPCLDIGLKIKNYSELDNITFYCPFDLNKVIDLSKKLESKNNASIIFNTDCEIETKDSYTIVNIAEAKENLLIFPLEQVIKDVFEIKRDSINEGTQIVFRFENFYAYVSDVDKLKALDTVYIRFRVQSPALKKHIYFDSEPLNKSFESAFSGTRIIDFKVNEKRNIDERIRAEIIVNKQEWVEFENIHFLVMVPSSYDLTSFYKSSMTCRELEENLWDDYLGAHIDFSSGHVLAYHWKDKAWDGKKCEDFACLVKVNYSRAKKTTIFLYALSVVALGVLSSVLVTGLAAFFPADEILFWVIGLVVVAFVIMLITWLGKKI